MSSIKHLYGPLSVSPQISPADLDAIKKAGITTIINNRPDGEAFGQPSSASLSAKAAELGLSYVHIPLTPGQLTPEIITRFGEALQNADGPVLAFCRTGTRSTTLWAMSRAGRLPSGEILAAAEQAGYDLGNLKPALETLH